MAFVATATLVASSGCRGWVRGQAGGALSVDGEARASGAIGAVDATLALPALPGVNGGEPLPFGVHTSADVVLAPDRTSVGWGTGLAFYEPPRPIAPYALAGTSFHLDDVGGAFALGGVSPYAELGVLASVPARMEDGGDGLFLSMGITSATYFSYLVGDRVVVDSYGLLKFGVGWESD